MALCFGSFNIPGLVCNDYGLQILSFFSYVFSLSILPPGCLWILGKSHSPKNGMKALQLSFPDIKIDSLCQVLIQCDQTIPIKELVRSIQ